ncbi:Prpf4b [Symbiodinium microadriaticum]|nr:Prpf4b [Symbiodinium microadriaticum]
MYCFLTDGLATSSHGLIRLVVSKAKLAPSATTRAVAALSCRGLCSRFGATSRLKPLAATAALSLPLAGRRSLSTEEAPWTTTASGLQYRDLSVAWSCMDQDHLETCARRSLHRSHGQLEEFCPRGAMSMQKSRSLPRLPGPGQQKFPRIRVVHRLDPAHIALREQRLGIQLTEKKETRPRTPSVVFGEIEEMLAQEKISWSSKERRVLLADQMANTLDVASRGAKAAAKLNQPAPEVEIVIPKEPEEVFENLDSFVPDSVPRKLAEALDECSVSMGNLLEEVAKTDSMLQRDLESEFWQEDEKVVEETPAEVVARDPGPALLAAREVPALFKDIEAHLPRSKRKAYETLRSAGAVDLHRYLEENFEGALERRDDGMQWVHRVMHRKDRVPGQSVWTKKAPRLQLLDSERFERRLELGLGAVVGEGEAPVKGQKVKVHYTGKLENGQVFDSSIPRGEPLDFNVGKGQVIAGWDEGILTMRVGGKRELKIPPKLGYGSRGIGPIPGNATLFFECELVRLKALHVQRNGQAGIVEDYVRTKQRWRVRLLISGKSHDFKAENLEIEEAADRPPPADWVGPDLEAELEIQPKVAYKEVAEEPLKLTALAAGCKVMLHGLKAAPELNGQRGEVESFVSESSRWRVKLLGGSIKDLKPDNLRPLSASELDASATALSELDALEADLGIDFAAAPGDACGPDGRFVIEDKLGEGTFSTVFRCRDTCADNAKYAVKFTRSNEQTRRALEREIKIMGQLIAKVGERDPEGMRAILTLAFFEGFKHKGRLAAVFELMKCNLRTALAKYGAGKGLPLLPTVRDFGRQLFLALRVLRRAGLIHCDVKPENLLLGGDNATIKLSDFGSCQGLEQRLKSDQLMPRNYRAPEIIVGLDYDYSVDVWSAGATLFELATDSVLFQGETNNDMLHAMFKVCGSCTKSFAMSGTFTHNHFSASGEFLNAKGDVAIKSANPRVVPLDAFDPPSRPLRFLLEDVLKRPPKGVTASRHEGLVSHFSDLLSSCQRIAPESRVTAESALGHKFFQKGSVVQLGFKNTHEVLDEPTSRQSELTELMG